jgi:hypothetical protein
MHLLRIIFLITIVSCICSCDKQRIQGNEISHNGTSQQMPQIQDVSDKNIFAMSEPLIELERTNGECFDLCPIYKVSISSDGEVVFEGKQNVKNLGIVKSKLPEVKLKELIASFKDANFFTLSDRYIQGSECVELWSDSPTVRIYYRSENLSKTIYHYQGCQGSEELKRLFKLEITIEKIVNTKQWVGF